MKLISDERKAKRVFEREIKRWRRILLIDPIWAIRINISEDEDMELGDASVDIGTAEYYVTNINIARALLSLKKGQLEMTATSVACHELLHVATADYQRAALIAAGENVQMQEELRYRYEQLVSKFSMILIDFDSQFENEEAESVCKKSRSCESSVQQEKETMA